MLSLPLLLMRKSRLTRGICIALARLPTTQSLILRTLVQASSLLWENLINAACGHCGTGLDKITLHRPSVKDSFSIRYKSRSLGLPTHSPFFRRCGHHFDSNNYPTSCLFDCYSSCTYHTRFLARRQTYPRTITRDVELTGSFPHIHTQTHNTDRVASYIFVCMLPPEPIGASCTG